MIRTNRIVLDTNVLVSALMKPEGPPAHILDRVLDGRLQAVFDDRILSEYREVLRRPRFALSQPDVDALLDYLLVSGLNLLDVSRLHINLPDPNDAPFVEVARAADAVLVTGNGRHFPDTAMKDLGITVLTPARFLMDQASH